MECDANVILFPVLFYQLVLNVYHMLTSWTTSQTVSMEYRKRAQIYFHRIQNNIVDFGIEALTSIYMAFVQWVTETCFWISIFCHENLTANLDTK